MSEPASFTHMRGELDAGRQQLEATKCTGVSGTTIANPYTPAPVDLVNHPPHYTGGKTETIEIIEQIVAAYDDPVLAFLVGQVIKYLARAPHKGALEQDLRKARWYLTRAVDRF